MCSLRFQDKKNSLKFIFLSKLNFEEKVVHNIMRRGFH